MNSVKLFVYFCAGMFISMGVYGSAAAQTETRLDSMVITATKTQKGVDGITASVDVITQEEIKMMALQH